jgi:D-lactate dehydrogenase
MCLNRALHKCYARVREGNFTLNGLTGFDVCGKTVGIVGALAAARVCGVPRSWVG